MHMRSTPSEIITDAPPTTHIYTIIHTISVLCCKIINFLLRNQILIQKVYNLFYNISIKI